MTDHGEVVIDGVSYDREIEVDGVVYVRLYFPTGRIFGDPSSFMNQFDEKQRNEIRRKMMEHLVEAGMFMRKKDYEKEYNHSSYGKDELFYGM